MKNNAVLYLAKIKRTQKESSAALKRAALEDFFENEDFETEILEKGKPIITKPAGFGMSLSHSKGCIALIVAPFEIGFDIEEIDKAFPKRVFEGCFTPCQKSIADTSTAKFEMWVKKEAFVKFTGDGISGIKKEIPEDVVFQSFSEELSHFFDKPIVAMSATRKRFDYSVRYIDI